MNNKEIIAATIKYRKYENKTGTTTEKAPILGLVETAGTCDHDAFVAQMRKDGCTESEASINLILNAHDAVVQEQVGEYHRKVKTPVGIYRPHITGSFETADAAPGPDNALVCGLLVNAATRDILAGVTPVEDKEGRAEIAAPQILSVFTPSRKEFAGIIGTETFRVVGSGIGVNHRTTDVFRLVSLKTGLATNVTSYTSTQGLLIEAQLTTALTPGDYRLEIGTDGGVEGNPFRSAMRNVTVK